MESQPHKMICPRCNIESGPSLFCYVCDAYLPSAAGGVKASIPSRLGAFLLDVLAFLTLPLIVGFIAIRAGVNFGNSYEDHGLKIFLIAFLGAGFGYLLLSLGLLVRGQTPGKWLLDIRAVDKRNGSGPGLARMLFRETFGKWTSGCFLGLGWFWAIWDRDTQAWHDKISGTVVLYRHTQLRKLPFLCLLFAAFALSVVGIWVSLRGQTEIERDNAASLSKATSALSHQQFLVPPSGLTQGSVLGFRGGESASDMVQRAGGMEYRLAGCHQRSADAPEYVDCRFARDNGDSLEASFLEGGLQRLDLKFKIENYDQVLKAIQRDNGVPEVVDLPDLTFLQWGNPLAGLVGGSDAAKGFSIHLGKTADMKKGYMTAIFSASTN